MVDHPHSPLSMYCTMYNTQLHNPSFTASHAAVNREGRRTRERVFRVSKVHLFQKR